MKDFKPSGIVSLLTDFGFGDDYVGSMHASLYSINPEIRIVDLCHDILPGDIEAAAFLLAKDYKVFPAGTVHLAVVDPGVGGDREIIAAVMDGHVFLAPDNGLLDALLSNGEGKKVFTVNNQELFHQKVSPTFHGRDIFTPVAAYISAGGNLTDVGPEKSEWMKGPQVEPRLVGDILVGRVMWVDRFGNLITNLPADSIEEYSIQIAGIRPRLVTTFNDGNPGEPVCLTGSKNTIEVVINGGDAAKTLGLGQGTNVKALPR